MTVDVNPNAQPVSTPSGVPASFTALPAVPTAPVPAGESFSSSPDLTEAPSGNAHAPIVAGIKNWYQQTPSVTQQPASTAKQATTTAMKVNQAKTGLQTVSSATDGFKSLSGSSGTAAASPDSGTLGKAAGPVGLLFSGVAAKNAVHELTHGHKVNGTFDAVGAGAGVVGSAAGTAKMFKLAPASAAGTLGTVAAGAGGVCAVADGAKSLYDGAKSGNKAEMAEGGLKTGAGGLMLAGAATADPLMIGAGAAIYAGDKLFENRHEIGHLASEGAKTVAHLGSDVMKAVTDPIAAAGNAVQSLTSKL